MFLFRRIVAVAVSCVFVSGAGAADNERMSAEFSSETGEAAVMVRYHDAQNHYQVRLLEDKLEFVRVKDGARTELGEATVPAASGYRPGEKWTFECAASGNTVSARLRDEAGVEVTSGTVFDRSISGGVIKPAEADGLAWSDVTTATLPAYTTDAAQLKGEYDVVVAGAGTAGSMAAIQAARLGASVLVVEESDWIGGQMAAAAVTSMDEGAEYPPHGVDRNGVRERGLYREFFDFAQHLYGTMGLSTDTCYITENHFGLEPATAQALLYEMFQRERIAGAVIDVALETSVTKVVKAGDKITGVELQVHTPDGAVAKAVKSRILIDATEYGDILPLADIPYRVGNWTSDEIDMTADEFPLVQDFTWTAVIETYPDGAPDRLMMKTPPPGYDKSEFETALDHPEPTSSTTPWSWQRFIGYRGMPNVDRPGESAQNPWADVSKTHMNIGANDGHVDVRHVENLDARLELEYELKLATLRLLYYIQNDMTEPMTTWTVALDEGFDTPYNRAQTRRLIERYPELAPYAELLYQFPPIPYARESRRMIGMHTVRAREIDRRTGPMIFPTSVAVGDYAVDLHGADSPDRLELELDEPADLGAIGFAGNQVGPFTIPFEAFIPEKADGFLAAEKNISQSRLVNGATRLQPSTMLIGQAAGAIAGLAISKGVNPRELQPVEVQKVLLDAGDVLYAARYDAHKLPGVAMGTELWKSLQLCLLHGVVQVSDAHQHLSGLKVLAGGSGASGWQVKDNKLHFSGEGNGIAVLDRDLVRGAGGSDNDYTVAATFARSGGVGAVGVVGRLKDASNFYHARFFGNKLELYKWDGNKATVLQSTPVKYKHGTTWTVSMTMEGEKISAAMLDAQGQILGEVAVVDSSHKAGSGGVRLQPGASHYVQVLELEVKPASGGAGSGYATEFQEPLNFNSSPLSRGQFAIHLARYLGADLQTSAGMPYEDLKPGHHAFSAVAALEERGIKLAPSGDGKFNADAVMTGGEAAKALTQALKMESANLAEKYLHASDGNFQPEQELTMGDSLRLFGGLITNRPSAAEGIVPVRRDAWMPK